MRLIHAFGMLSKLRINANFHILKTAYHSLLELHMQYGTQLYDGVAKKNNNNNRRRSFTFQKEKLQNSALRKITFKKCHKRICCVYKECKILKFPGILNLQNCLSLCTKSSIAPNSSVPLIFSYCYLYAIAKDKHNYN